MVAGNGGKDTSHYSVVRQRAGDPAELMEKRGFDTGGKAVQPGL